MSIKTSNVKSKYIEGAIKRGNHGQRERGREKEN